MKSVKIDFKRDPTWEYIEPIVPASEAIPDWFKNASRVLPNSKPYDGSTITFKSCPAILDSLLQGYILPLWADIWVEPSGEEIDGMSIPSFHWSNYLGGGAYGEPLITANYVGLSKGLLTVDEKSTAPMTWKLNSPWIIQTPKEYSLLVIPPLNNVDSRFEAVSGVICTDMFTSFLNIPFIWTAPPDYEGLIRQGTPLAQLIPFKREVFQQELGFITEDDMNREAACKHALGGVFRNAYTKLFRKTALSK